MSAISTSGSDIRQQERHVFTLNARRIINTYRSDLYQQSSQQTRYRHLPVLIAGAHDYVGGSAQGLCPTRNSHRVSPFDSSNIGLCAKAIWRQHVETDISPLEPVTDTLRLETV